MTQIAIKWWLKQKLNGNGLQLTKYWVCHQCGQHIPAGGIETHNIRHLTQGAVKPNSAANAAELAAFLTLMFKLIAWIIKILFKITRRIYIFSRGKPKLAFQILIIVTIFLTAIYTYYEPSQESHQVGKISHSGRSIDRTH